LPTQADRVDRKMTTQPGVVTFNIKSIIIGKLELALNQKIASPGIVHFFFEEHLKVIPSFRSRHRIEMQLNHVLRAHQQPLDGVGGATVPESLRYKQDVILPDSYRLPALRKDA
jgi:hypothetical protein